MAPLMRMVEGRPGAIGLAGGASRPLRPGARISEPGTAISGRSSQSPFHNSAVGRASSRSTGSLPPPSHKISLLYCTAPGGTCVRAICRGRHRVENRVGEV